MDIPTAESAVLASIILSGGDELDELDYLIGDDFESPWHEELFDYMREARAQGQPIDPIMLTSRFRSREAEIWSLTNYLPQSRMVEHHARIVAGHGLQRRLRAVAAGLLQIASGDPTEVSMESARLMLDRAEGPAPLRLRYASDALGALEEQLKNGTPFVPTPWPQLNQLIGGLRPGALYVIGARPGVGKSVVAAQLATEMSKYGGVAFSSLEMSETEIIGRIVSERLGIYVGKMKNADLTLKDWDLLGRHRTQITGLQIAIDDRSSVQPTEIRQFARAVQRNGSLVCIVVDYLQLMASTSKQDRHVVVSEFTRQMKIMAKELKVPVVVLSQLNRMSEQRGQDARPRLSELRESGSIEQDADVVILLSRPETEDGLDHILFDVAKNRHGPTGDALLDWHGFVSRVVDPRATPEQTAEARGARPMEGTETP